MIINHNLSAMNATRLSNINERNVNTDTARLASGMRINTAADDASGLAVSEKMRAQVRGLNQASRNAQDGLSLIQTAAGNLGNLTDVLQRLRELSVQSANGIYTAADRQQIQVEVSALVDEVDRIANQSQFNGLNLLSGRFAKETGTNVVRGSMWIHVGANMDQRIRLYIGTMTASALGLKNQLTSKKLDLSTQASSNRSIGILDQALHTVSAQRADLGAQANRIQFTIKGDDISSQNLQAAESRIRDLDMAKGVVKMTKNNILFQSSQAMIAQANQRPQAILQLLR